MFRIKLPLILLAVVFFASRGANGQATRSPFSSFGYGDYHGDGLANNQGMGGTGVSSPQLWFLNNQNPALLVFNRLTVFQAGIVGGQNQVSSSDLKEKNRGGNMNYLALGFPVNRRKSGEVVWASAFGLIPYSNVNYRFQYKDIIPGSGGTGISYLESAKGGFNQFYSSNGVRITNNISVGLKTSMLFSSIASDYSNLLDTLSQSARYIINVHELQSVKGLIFTPGISFRLDSIANKYSFNIGATAELKSSQSSKLEQVLERKSFGGNVLQSDTIQDNSVKIKFPQRLSLGISFGQMNKWMIASDFSISTFGSPTTLIGLDEVPVQKGWKLAVGAEYTPDERSLSSYLKRVTYRAGASTEESMYLVNGNAVKDFGINFGLSFPVNRLSTLDLAIRSGKRGDKSLNGIEENYFKLYFGVTFNDQWFIKRRFD